MGRRPALSSPTGLVLAMRRKSLEGQLARIGPAPQWLAAGKAGPAARDPAKTDYDLQKYGGGPWKLPHLQVPTHSLYGECRPRHSEIKYSPIQIRVPILLARELYCEHYHPFCLAGF